MVIETRTDRVTLDAKSISAASYWNARLRDVSGEKYFVDPVTTSGKKGRTAEYSFTPDAFIAGELTRVAKTGVSKLIMLTATVAILARKASGLTNFVIFSSPASSGILSSATGFVPIRFSDFSSLTFQQFLSEVKRDMLADFSNAIEPSPAIIEKFTNDSTGKGFAGVMIGANDTELSNDSRPDITFCFETEEDLILNVSYNAGIFGEAYIRQLCVSFFNLLGNLIAHKDKAIRSVDMLSESEVAVTDERKELTARAFDGETIVSLFRATVGRTPKSVAVMGDKGNLSYKDLDRLSNRLARFLVARKITSGTRVAIEIGHNQWAIIAMLGVLKAGAAYIPIEHNLAASRKEQILKDSEARLLFVDGIHFSSVDYFRGTVIALDVDFEEMEFETLPLEDVVSANDIAYILYTSGSTGTPKGVVISHQALANYIRWSSVYCGEKPPAFAFFTSIGFDLTVTSIFLPLITGGRIVVLSWDDKGLAVKNILEDPKTDMIKLTPSHLRSLSALPQINTSSWTKNKVLIVGGEMFGSELAKSIYNKCDGKVEIYNEYGPTEATVGCMIHKFSPSEDSTSVPIGRSIENMRIYLLNKDLQPVPPYFMGEIYISGVGLAQGYLSDASQTAAAFVEDPLQAGARMYKSGDLAYRMADDTIIYSGRADKQVKIRGFRVEMEEISAWMSKYPSVSQAVVVCRAKGDEPYLVAFYEAPKEIKEEEFTTFLSEHLPNYMVPAFFRRLERIPLNTNGKLDEAALKFDMEENKESYVAPANNIEDQLTNIWADILQIDKARIGVNESFFSLGGHSLYAISLIYKIKEELGADVDLDQVFELKTIRALSAAIRGTNAIETKPLLKSVERNFYPVSSAQERLFFGQLANQQSLTNNIPRSYRIDKNFDLARLRSALNALVDRHESLRTGFEFNGDEVIQRIYNNVKVSLQIYHAKDFQSPDDAFTDFVRPFDLCGMSMIRFALYKTADDHYAFLFVDIHHIVCDGISLNILMNDFMDIYDSRQLLPVKARYVDYSMEQRSAGNDLRSQRDYWLKQLSGEIPRVSMPLRSDRQSAQIHDAAVETRRLSPELYERIKEYCSASDITPFVFFLSAYYLAVSKISGDTDVIIGTDAIGRSHPGLAHVVGTFINVLPLRIKIDSREPFASIVSRVKQTTLEGFSCQDYQIDRLVADLGKSGSDKLFDLYFSFTNFFSEDRNRSNLVFQPAPLGAVQPATRYELELNVSESEGNASLIFIYSPALYDRDTILLLAKYYNEILHTKSIIQ